MRLRIVGESVIEVGDRRITPTSPRLFALLLYLGTEHSREVSRAELIDLLYDDSAPNEECSHRLRQSLYKLRRMGAPIAVDDRTVRADSRRVRSTVAELLTGGWEIRRERLSESFEILPHYSPAAATPLNDWVEQLRERLQNALRQSLTHDMEIARRKADWRYLEAIARRTLELDPLNESAVLARAEAIARTGSKARALSILNAYRSELGEDRPSLVLPASILAKRIDATREHVPAARHEPIPLIGRERELEFLLSQWQSVRRGGAHMLWLTGNKSVGKTRLSEELVSNVLISGTGLVVAFSMSAMDTDRPLSLFAALANQLSALPGAAGCDPVSLQTLGKLSGSISIPRAVNPDNANATHSDAAVRNAICDLVACVTDERPVLVVIDDAHHLDDASALLLDVVLTRIHDKRLLIVHCGVVEPLSQRHRHTTLHLEPLSQAASQELWQSLLTAQGSALPERISRMCQDTAAGNPGHMELLAQQAVQDPEQFLIPIDLITLTDRRLGHLSTHAHYVLEAMVILGDAATAASVAYLTGLSTYDLLTALHELESGDLVVNGQAGLRCRSGLIAERVRATSSSAVTSMMEGRAAEYLEREQSGERWSPSTAWRIASHWQRAGEPRRARAYLRAGWQHAVSLGQPARASDAISEALTASSDPEDRASLLDDLIGALQAAGDLKAVIPAVSERRSLSSRVHDTPSRMAQLAFDEDEANWTRNTKPSVTLESFRTHIESSLLNPHRRLRAARLLMMAAEGDLDRAVAKYTVNSCKKIVPEDSHSRLLQSYVNLIYHTIFGERDLALRIADEIQEEARNLERSWYALMLERNCAFARHLVGSGESEYECFERGFARALDASMTPIALWFAGSLMSVLVDDGDLPGAQSWMATAEKVATRFESQDLPIDYLGAQIDISLLVGDHRKARRYLRIIDKCAGYRSRRVRNELFIYRLRVRQSCGDSWHPDVHLNELLKFHEVGKCLTRHDDHMEVLWQALTAVGQPERASALLTDYLQVHRRERRPCRFLLRLRTESDPAWNSETFHIKPAVVVRN